MKHTLQVINQMQAAGVIGKYAIGGAVGATVYLEPAATLDIDIFVSFPDRPGSLIVSPQPIYDYLVRTLGYKVENEHVLVESWPVQFLPADDALHQEALEQAHPLDLEGVQTWVMTAEHLMALALNTGRKKDDWRLELFLESGRYDENKLQGILRRHNLIDKWRQFIDKQGGSNK
jgi:hypothetical protein